jgi:hypothetical protein
MQIYILEKGFIHKLFMLIAFSLFTAVMYQGHINKHGIYTILFFIFLALCAYQIVSILYVIFIKRTLELNINDEKISWKLFDNKRLHKEFEIKRSEIEEVKTEINYLTGNVYSSFSAIFKLKNKETVVLTDGILYDFDLKKAEQICTFLLNYEIGDIQDIKFVQLIKELNINLEKEQVFTKNESASYFLGVISKNKKEFLGLRLQIEGLYTDYKKVEKNANNEFLVKSDKIKDSYIYLRSNAIGYLIEFHNIKRKEDLKMLKSMKRQKFSF